MKCRLIIISLLLVSAASFSQDTLRQTNAGNYGAQQYYVLHDDGRFTYSSSCMCTGAQVYGAGKYELKGKTYNFTFEPLPKLQTSIQCDGPAATDSVYFMMPPILPCSTA